MPQPTNDIIEITVEGTMQNQIVNNVYHFVTENGGVDGEQVAESVLDVLQTHLPIASSDGYEVTSVQWRNLFDASDEGEIAVTGLTGGGTASKMPVHDTVSVQLIHNEPSIRKGRKSFSGLTEDQVAEGLVATATVTAYTDFASDLMTVPLASSIDPLIPIARAVVVKRIPQLVEGLTRYRLPANVSEAVVGYIFDVFVDLYVRTQNSRKIGTGE